MAASLTQASVRRAPEAVLKWFWARLGDTSGRLDRHGLIAPLMISAAIVFAVSIVLFFSFISRPGAFQGPRAFVRVVELPILIVAAVLFYRPVARRFHDIGLSALNAAWLGVSLIMAEWIKLHIEWITRQLEDGSTISSPAPGNWLIYGIATIPQLAFCALALWPGSKGPNRYGPPPA